MNLPVYLLVMDPDDIKEELVDEAKRVLDEQMTHKEKMEKKAVEDSKRKDGRPWTEQEIEYLKNNRKEMSNEELKEFMKGNEYSDEDWKPFSRTEERYIIQSIGTTEVEEIASGLNRDVERVEKKIKMMGLEVPAE